MNEPRAASQPRPDLLHHLSFIARVAFSSCGGNTPGVALPGTTGRMRNVKPWPAMLLKPRIANTVGMVLGGGLLAFFGIGGWISIGGVAGLIPGVFGVLGVFWIVAGSFALARRKDRVIIIDDYGIELPCFSIFAKTSHKRFISRNDIAEVSKHESLRGRLIEISMFSGLKLFVQARNYCELEEFITHCRRYGFPVA